MKKTSELEKKCENCKFYRQHYVKRGTKFITVNCAHCTYRINKKLSLCEHWEENR